MDHPVQIIYLQCLHHSVTHIKGGAHVSNASVHLAKSLALVQSFYVQNLARNILLHNDVLSGG